MIPSALILAPAAINLSCNALTVGSDLPVGAAGAAGAVGAAGFAPCAGAAGAPPNQVGAYF
jgi:hypothetical protein